MKDTRLLTPEDFCDIDEALTHAKELRRLLIRLSVSGHGFGVCAADLLYQLDTDLPWLEACVRGDIEASKELP